MRQHSNLAKDTAEKVVKDIRRATRKQYSAEEKIRIVLEGLRSEDSIAALCRREGIAQNLYYRWSKDFLEAGKKRLAGDTARAATSDEAAIDVFADKYNAKHDKAVACLTKAGKRSSPSSTSPPSTGTICARQPDRKRVRDGASSNCEDERSPVGEDGQAYGVQTCQRRRENMATIEGLKSVAESRPRHQIPNGIEVIKMSAHHAA